MEKNILASFLLLFGAIMTIQGQNIITVDNSVGASAQFSDLQSAISGAAPGDIIYVHPSETNYGDISIDKSIDLIGFSHNDVDKKTLVDEIDLLDNASNTRISGFHITNDINALNTNVELNTITIENNLIDGTIWSGMAYSGVSGMIIRGNVMYRIGSNSSTWLNYTNTIISNNVITSFIYTNFHESITIKNNIFIEGSYPVNVGNATGDLKVQNCIFYESSGATVNINGSGVLYENCLSYNIGGGSYSTLVGTNNLNNQNPLFVEDNNNTTFEAEIDDYKLKTGSPGIDAGINGEDIGLFDGSNFTFNNFGYTNGIPTVTIDAISTTVAPGQDLNVIISTTNH